MRHFFFRHDIHSLFFLPSLSKPKKIWHSPEWKHPTREIEAMKTRLSPPPNSTLFSFGLRKTVLSPLADPSFLLLHYIMYLMCLHLKTNFCRFIPIDLSSQECAIIDLIILQVKGTCIVLLTFFLHDIICIGIKIYQELI
jgi:hypothetical protein